MTSEQLDNLVSLMQDPEKVEEFCHECAGIVRGLRLAHIKGRVIPSAYISRLKAIIDGQMVFLELHRDDLLFVKGLEEIGLFLCVGNR